MYIIIEWNLNLANANIVMDNDSNDEAGNAIFITEAEAVSFAELNCAFQWQVVKITKEN